MDIPLDCLCSNPADCNTYCIHLVYYKTPLPSKHICYYIIIVKHDTVKHACLV